MEKKIWSKPEVSVLQFAANDYVSTCLASYTAQLICMLPNDPTKVDGYNGSSCGLDSHHNGGCHNVNVYGTPCQSFHDEDGNWHGTCANNNNFFTYDGNNNVGYGYEGDNNVWGIELGQKIENYDANFSYNFFTTDGIGPLLENLTDAGHYLVSWLSGKLGTTEWRRHYGVATISDVIQQGNPNRS